MSAQPCRTARPVVLTDDQALQIRKLVARHGEHGAMVTLRCGVATLDALRSGVAAPKTVARIAARLDEIREGAMTTTEIAPCDLARMRITTGIGRDVLEARIKALAGEVAELRALAAALEVNLTAVQTRCTQLLLENRALRLTGSDETRFLVAVFDQLQLARAKYPGNAHRLAAVAEEAGEAARALNKGEGPERLYAECVDVAACALRLALEGDAAFPGSGRDGVR